MEQLRGMLRRVLSCTLCLVLLGLCTGCGVTDRIRPDLNLNDGIRVLMDESPVEGDDSNVQLGDETTVVTPASSVWSGGSPNKGNFEYKSPNRDVEPDNFVGTPYDMVEATDYCQYLREQVYDQLNFAISSLSDEKKASIYIRVGHTGYDYDATSKTAHRVPGWSQTTPGSTIVSEGVVGGYSLITLACDWVGDIDLNKGHQASQVSYAQSTITSYMSKEDMSKNWYELSGSRLPAIYYKMFGRESGGFKTLQEYYDAIATEPYKNIPNYTLNYYTRANTSNKMTFNKTSGSTADRFVEGVPTETVDKLFSTYNQYETRERALVTNKVVDTESLLKYSLDGYNKTIIFIGTTAGGNLRDVVGDTIYKNIQDIVFNAYMCTDVSSITSFKKNVYDDNTGSILNTYDYTASTVIPAGTKGVD